MTQMQSRPNLDGRGLEVRGWVAYGYSIRLVWEGLGGLGMGYEWLAGLVSIGFAYTWTGGAGRSGAGL